MSQQAEDAKKEKEEEDEVEESVSFVKLFSFATPFDVFLIIFGILNAICTGVSLPVFTLFFKDLIDDGFGGGTEGLGDDAIRDTAYKFLYISIAMFVCGTVSNGALLLAAANQGAAIRKAYVRSILRQDISWFDTHKSGELTTSLERDCANIQQAIGEKVTLAVHHGVTFIAGIILGFQQGWMMSLVLMSALPFVAGSGAWMAKSLQTMQEGAEASYRSAGGIAEQAISGIRTVASLRAEGREVTRYKASLDGALQNGIKKGWTNGLGFGMVMGSLFGTYALGLWFGSWLIVNKKENDATGEVYTGGEVILVFFCIIMGSFGIGQMGPAIQAFGTGRASAKRVFSIIERVPNINVDSADGLKPASVRGDISLQNLAFSYPSRPNDPVFTSLTLDIAAGQTVALVGSSGSGKSTVVQLILRFYDPASGKVTLDGVDVRELNVKWLRQQIKLVSQEPVLFAVSILENVRYGKDQATAEEVKEACVASNAHRFIANLPDQYETQCGERGRQMSGGEKQRIAIARAIINNPRVLLLDEATSALDAESEKLVQSALENLVGGRTTVVVAHRLSTIRSADNIIVFRAGQIAEAGRHEELLARGGVYRELVAQQMQAGQGPAREAGGAERVNEKQGVGATEAVGRIASGGSENKGTEAKEEEDKEADEGKGLFMRALRLNKPEWGYIPFALLGSAMNGAMFPVLAFLLVEMLGAYFQCIEDLSPRGITEVMTFYPRASDCESDCRWSNVSDTWLSAPCDWNDIRADVCVQYIPLGDPDAVLGMRYYAEEGICYDEMQAIVTRYSLGFVGLAVGALVGHIIQIYSLTVMAENLTRRLRELTFFSVLRQEIGFFDFKENETGVITNKLAKETAYVEGAVGTTIGLAIQNLILLGISLVIAFSRGWMLTLICFSTFPLMVIGQYLQIQFIQGAGGESNKAYALASGVANEAVTSIRTVAAFAAEEKVSQLYHSAITLDSSGVKKTAFVAGMGQGFSLFTIFFLYFCGFAGGAHLMQHHGYTFDDVLQVFFSVTFMGMGAGQAGALAPDIAKAKPAMIAIFKLIDRVPAIDAESEDGDRTTRIQGSIQLKDVVFRYPTREINIFSGINISIQTGQTVALVGASGSGKSTVISLIERFYDPISGQVLIDGRNVKEFNLKHLRSQLSLVAQEPVLFATSIKENIRYGRDDATAEEIAAAATKANAMEFISQSPDGMERMCGDKGGELSGGQKQRIAIARAMVTHPRFVHASAADRMQTTARCSWLDSPGQVANPRILLLDEGVLPLSDARCSNGIPIILSASPPFSFSLTCSVSAATSALDATSEKLVQSALESLMQDRTTVVVAHRLSTIRSADNIIVFRAGAVVEQGSHDQLLKVGPEGYYATLIANQMGH